MSPVCLSVCAGAELLPGKDVSAATGRTFPAPFAALDVLLAALPSLLPGAVWVCAVQGWHSTITVTGGDSRRGRGWGGGEEGSSSSRLLGALGWGCRAGSSLTVPWLCQKCGY